jgi:predicted nucleic acid-binding protein
LIAGYPSYQDSLLNSLERESAEAAVGRAAVWDPVAVAVVAILPRPIGEKIRLALPASVVAQAALDDVSRTGEDPAAGRSEYSVIGFDPETDRGWIHEYDAEDVERQRAESIRAVEITRTLNVRPDVEPAKPSALDQFLLDEDREPAFATWPATLAIAERDQLPLYSDDRFVRAHARRAGIQSFGTLALVDALSEAGHLSSDKRQQVRELLLARGAHGVAFTLDELLREARAADWSLTPSLAFALTDPTNWGQSVAETFRLWSAFLRAAFDEAQEDEFRMWVLRFLDAARIGLEPRGYGFVARLLLMVAWEPFTPERRPFLHALIRELRAARSVFGWFADPLAEAARDLSAVISQGEEKPVRALLAQALLQDVPFEDQLMLLGVRQPWK